MAAAAIWENTTTVVAIAAAVLFLLYKAVRGASCRLPPGPRPWPVVGNLPDITPVRFQCFLAWATRYGPVMSVWMGPTLNVVVSSAAAAQEMLKEKDQTLASRPLTRAAARFSRNGQDLIWADYGPHYVKVRKVCTLELFTAKRLEALRPVREDEVGAMMAALWTDCTNLVTVRRYLSAMAFNNITRIVFGKRFVDDAGEVDAQGREFKEVIAQGMKLGASLTMSEHIPYLRWMFPLQEEEFAKHGARRDALTKRIMEEHKVKEGDGHHFVDALQELQKQYDLSETTVIGLLWDMITAGMDTTAISVEWALAELVRHPDVQTKAQEELDQVVGPDRVVTESDFPRLPYLHALAKESLRLHPPTPLMLPHKAQTRTTLAGFDIPKDTVLHCNVYAIARDPSLWPEPLQFRPERFLASEGGEDVDMKGHDFRLLPFGAGRRVCPGAQLGIVMVELMLARLLHQFRWSGGDNEVDMTERPGVVTFMAKPLVAVATPRLKADLYRR